MNAATRVARSDWNGVAVLAVEAIDNRPRFVVKDPFGNGIELTQILGRYTPVAE